MPYPIYRPRRLRESPLVRKMVRETTLRADRPHLPAVRRPRPGRARSRSRRCRASPGSPSTSCVRECKDVAGLGIPAVLLFGLPQEKDPRGSEAYAEDGIVQQAIRAVKETIPDLLVITDVCLCEYTSHGHCGVVEDGRIKNDPTLELLARTALSHVEAGADMVAPSDMMDGRVGSHPRGARRVGLSGDADHGLLGEVRLGVLRAVPRGRRLHARSSATAAPTRWTPPTPSRPCARSPSTSTRAPTS